MNNQKPSKGKASYPVLATMETLCTLSKRADPNFYQSMIHIISAFDPQNKSGRDLRPQTIAG